MKKDIYRPKVEDVAVVVACESSPEGVDDWYVYIINLKEQPIKNVLVSSKGYGTINNERVRTSILRHYIGDIPAESYAKIEKIDESVFGLSNEYLVTFYIDKLIHDKKYIFLAESIQSENFVTLPLLNKKGVMIA